MPCVQMRLSFEKGIIVHTERRPIPNEPRQRTHQTVSRHRRDAFCAFVCVACREVASACFLCVSALTSLSVSETSTQLSETVAGGRPSPHDSRDHRVYDLSPRGREKVRERESEMGSSFGCVRVGSVAIPPTLSHQKGMWECKRESTVAVLSTICLDAVRHHCGRCPRSRTIWIPRRS